MASRITRTIGLAAAGVATAAVMGLMASPVSAAPNDQNDAQTGTVRVLNTAPDDVTPQAGWLGPCYPQLGSNWGGGWCDGNGPNWNYQGWVRCSNGGTYYGVVHWAGDRRGSYRTCPSGTWATAGGVDAFYIS